MTFAVSRFEASPLLTTPSPRQIECSYPSSRPPSKLFGHLSPPHLLAELATLASLCPTNPTLKGLRVCLIHCKQEFSGWDVRAQILQELREGARERLLPFECEWVGVERGTRLRESARSEACFCRQIVALTCFFLLFQAFESLAAAFSFLLVSLSRANTIYACNISSALATQTVLPPFFLLPFCPTVLLALACFVSL